ncbi:hypothetical protein KQX54_009784 [Cotesia glomerata]|uniref:Uncharacterized protein n=1 Tax=Cotesia glomerata TaxID=32391 RepID=A0AAV7IZU2_COTGL|nr:hypothetical protein KQX54_009784 [Cotesia glomerata]
MSVFVFLEDYSSREYEGVWICIPVDVDDESTYRARGFAHKSLLSLLSRNLEGSTPIDCSTSETLIPRFKLGGLDPALKFRAPALGLVDYLVVIYSKLLYCLLCRLVLEFARRSRSKSRSRGSKIWKTEDIPKLKPRATGSIFPECSSFKSLLVEEDVCIKVSHSRLQTPTSTSTLFVIHNPVSRIPISLEATDEDGNEEKYTAGSTSTNPYINFTIILQHHALLLAIAAYQYIFIAGKRPSG